MRSKFLALVALVVIGAVAWARPLPLTTDTATNNGLQYLLQRIEAIETATTTSTSFTTSTSTSSSTTTTTSTSSSSTTTTSSTTSTTTTTSTSTSTSTSSSTTTSTSSTTTTTLSLSNGANLVLVEPQCHTTTCLNLTNDPTVAEEADVEVRSGLTIIGVDPTNDIDANGFITGTGLVANNTTHGKYAQYETAASSGTTAGIGSPRNDSIRTVDDPRGTITLATDSSTIANTRIWAGWFSSSPMGAATATTLHAVGFRYDTGASDTAWQCVTNDGGVTATVTSSGITVATNTRYKFGIDAIDSASIKMYINDALVCTMTTDLPTTTQLMGIYTRLATLTGATRRLNFAQYQFLQN